MRVLVADDEPQALKLIEQTLRDTKGPGDMPYEVVTVSNHEEALLRLDKERFDAVVTDMVMGEGEREGMDILRALTSKSPITIVLTAYASIPNSVEAMRAGAWDYLEKVPKDGSDPYEKLLKSLREGYQHRIEHPEAGRSNPDTIWIQENLKHLVQEYPSEVIAVLDQKVLDHAPDYDSLMARLKEIHPILEPVVFSVPVLRENTI